MPPTEAASAQPGGDLAALDRAIAALEAQRAVLGDEVVETALAPLKERRGQLVSSQIGEQRKLVTILFADLVDFTVLSRRLDPEDTRAVVDACFARWHAAIEEQGGVVEKFIGDAVMAVFGLRQSWEDDTERAARAGLAMTEATAEVSRETRERYGVEVHMRVGIDTGEVVVSTFGERPGHEFVAVGPTVNRASRIQGAAPTDRVLVSTETYRQLRTSFNVEPMPGLQLKGLDGPVDAYLVVSERPRGFRMDRSGAVGGVEAATVGRTAELAFLQDRFRQVVDERRWQLVTVVGDAGVGKSRLLRDLDLWLAASTERVWWFRGRASQSRQSQANALTRDVIATRMEVHDSDSPAVVREKLEAGFARAFGPGEETRRAAYLVGVWLGFDLGDDALPGVPADPQSVRDQGTMALGRYFARLAEQYPVVILLEDLHWADAASVRLLESAEPLWRDLPMLVVATARPAFLEDRPDFGSGVDGLVRVRLDPLSEPDSRALVADLLHRVEDLPPGVVDLVVGPAEGNPFYLEELVTWLVDSGVVVPGQPTWTVVPELVGSLVVPPSLKGLLQARLDALTSQERALLQRASVVGRVFWDDAVSHLESRPELTADGTFDRLRDRDIVFERELSAFASAREFLFKHALLRDVAYDSVLRARRQQYHRRAAVWLAEISARSGRVEEYAALIGEHYDRAGDPVAAEWYLRAARRAARVFAVDEATDLLDRAEALTGPADAALRFDVLAVREEVMERRGDRARQDADLEQMVDLSGRLGDPARTVTTLLAWARRSFDSSEYAEAVHLASQAADVARRADLADRVAEAHLWVGKALTWNEQGTAADRELRTALRLSRRAGRTPLVAETLRYLAMLASNEGRYAEALDFGARSRAEFARDGDLEAESMASSQHGVTLFLLGRVHEAREAFESALPVFRASGHLYRQAVVLGNLASAAMLEGDLAAAGRWSAEGVVLTDQLEDRETGAMNRLIQGLVALATGRWPEARELFEAARDTAQEVGVLVLEVEASLALALGRLEFGADAEAVLAEGRAIVELSRSDAVSPQNQAKASLALAYALLGAGRPEQVVEAAETCRSVAAERVAQDLGAFRLEAGAGLAAAALARGDAAEAARVAGPLVDGLDDEQVAVTMWPPRVLRALHDALADDPVRREHVRVTTTEFVRRRVAGCEDERAAHGFLATPSVRDLIAALGLEVPGSAGRSG